MYSCSAATHCDNQTSEWNSHYLGQAQQPFMERKTKRTQERLLIQSRDHNRQIESQQKNIQADNRMKGHIQRWKCSFLHPLIVKVDSARSVPQVTMLLLFILSDLLVFYPR